jgi:hypothetical protein
MKRLHDVVGAQPVGDEGLGAVDDVLVAVALGGGANPGNVRPGAGLRDPNGADQLPLDGGDEIALLLLLGAEQVDRGGRHVGVNRHPHVEPAAARIAHRVRADERVVVVAALAAVLLRVAEADVAELAGAVEDGVRPQVLLILKAVGSELLQHPGLHRLAQLLVLVGEDEVLAARAVVGLDHAGSRGGHC